jgi:serine/threonine protein kinase
VPDAPEPEPSLAGLPAPGEVVVARYRYRLDRMLGQGSFGAVFLAEPIDAPPDVPRHVAVKVLSKDLKDRHRRHALQREVSALLALKSDRIPRVYDAVIDGDLPLVVMQYFKWGTLEAQLAHGPLLQIDAIRLLADLLSAVSSAHRASVLHLDIKPANVLLDGRDGYVLTDFGVSQAPRVGGLLPMAGLGSEGWQAPEQEARRTDALDLRTDLYGVGATVWSAITGVDLAGHTGKAARRRAATSPVGLPPLSTVVAVNPALEVLVMGLLMREPDARPGNPDEVLARVAALLSGRTVAPPPLPGRPVQGPELARVITNLVDPLVVASIGKTHGEVRALSDGEALCRQGDTSLHAYVLLYGTLRVEKDGKVLAKESREGEILGELAALTGEARNASLIAEGTAVVKVLDAAQLEALAASVPALAVRLLRSLATRYRRETP